MLPQYLIDQVGATAKRIDDERKEAVPARRAPIPTGGGPKAPRTKTPPRGHALEAWRERQAPSDEAIEHMACAYVAQDDACHAADCLLASPLSDDVEWADVLSDIEHLIPPRVAFARAQHA